jgi:hypothetical protein
MRAALPLLLASACAPPPLNPAVVGGTDAQVERVQRTLDLFRWEVYEELLPVVDRIVFEPPTNEHALGSWSRGQRRIRLLPTLEDREIDAVLRHELCHALDDQSSSPSARRTDWPVLDLDVSVDNDAWRRGELFAQLCAYGSAGLDLLLRSAGPCLSAALAEAAGDVDQDVFDPDQRAPITYLPAQMGTAAWDPEQGALSSLRDWRTPDVIGVDVEREERTAFTGLDLTDGNWDGQSLSAAPRRREHRIDRERALLPSAWSTDLYTVTDAPQHVVRVTQVPGAGTISIVGWTGEQATFLGDACVPERGQLAVGYHLLLASIRPDRLDWATAPAPTDPDAR